VGTLAGVFGGATERLAERLNGISQLAPHGESIALTAVVVAITYVSLILGDLVPKRVAFSNPERFAMAVAALMPLLSHLASRIVRFLTWSTDVVLRLFPIRSVAEMGKPLDVRSSFDPCRPCWKRCAP
jgi:putative hemolysin